MSIDLFCSLLFIVALFAGLLGALTGLGGGVVIIPVLALLFHIDIRYAMGASLISVMATSSGSAIAFLRDGYTNIRIGMFLEVGAVVGALVGALLVKSVPVAALAIIFGVVLLFSAYLTVKRKPQDSGAVTGHAWSQKLKLNGSYPTPEGEKSYQVHNVPAAFGIMTIAGTLAGLLGIGSGALKVLAMDQAMGLPYKVATTTSNFIIGITAAVSAGVYFSHGYIKPLIAGPVMIGVTIGAIGGAKLLSHVPTQKLRIVFSIVISLLALQLIYKGFTGGL